MKKIYLTVSLTLSALLILPVSSASISQTFTDDTNDVIDLVNENKTVNVPNIDISRITYYQSRNNVVITLEVVGSIDDQSIYTLSIETKGKDTNETPFNYEIFYTKNSQFAEEMGYPSGGVVINNSGDEISASFSKSDESKLRVSFNYDTDNEKPSTLYAITYIYDETKLLFGLDMAEFNISIESDTGPDTANSSSSDNGNSSEKGIPGFEIALLFIAIPTSLLIIRRKF